MCDACGFHRCAGDEFEVCDGQHCQEEAGSVLDDPGNDAVPICFQNDGPLDAADDPHHPSPACMGCHCRSRPVACEAACLRP
jgi:hypothetical protein